MWLKPLPPHLHPAMVAVKYGLAAFVAVTLAKWWVPKDVLSAAFVALLCAKPTLVSGLREGRDQVLASAVGAGSTMAWLIVFPISSVTVGLSIAATYAVSSYLRWSFPTLVVALFSSLYMTILAQDTLLHTAVLRFQSVLLGVGVALAINVVFAPLGYRTNLQVRVQRGLALVRARLARVAEGLRSGHESAGALVGGFGATYRGLDELKNEVTDLTRDVRFHKLPGGMSLVEASAGDRALRELEWVTHYTHDVTLAASRLDDPELLALAASQLEGAAEVLDRLSTEADDGAYDQVRAAREALRPLLGGAEDRARLVLALLQIQEHLGEVVLASRQLAVVEPAAVAARQV